VARAPDVRRVFVLPVVIDCHVRRARRQRRDIDPADFRPGLDPWRCDFVPALAAIARELHHAIIGSDPDLGVVLRSRRDAVDPSKAAAALRGWSRLTRALFELRIAMGQLWADLFPVLTAVHGSQQLLGGE